MSSRFFFSNIPRIYAREVFKYYYGPNQLRQAGTRANNAAAFVSNKLNEISEIVCIIALNMFGRPRAAKYEGLPGVETNSNRFYFRFPPPCRPGSKLSEINFALLNLNNNKYRITRS